MNETCSPAFFSQIEVLFYSNQKFLFLSSHRRSSSNLFGDFLADLRDVLNERNESLAVRFDRVFDLGVAVKTFDFEKKRFVDLRRNHFVHGVV